MNKKKGYYFKKGKDGSLYLNVFKPDFINYLGDLETETEWLKFRIFEREKADDKGHTHNMELIAGSEQKHK